jgi:Cdc6-like AAA superfamily ATPase
MDMLLGLTGLRRVKMSAVSLFKQGIAFSKMDPATRKENFPSLNYVFLGNPGTGKTTVGKLFAQILHDTGLRKKQAFEDCTAQKAKDDGVDEFRKTAQKAMDGVLFVDEAYDLDPIGDPFKGRPIVNELLTLSENERERLTIILAGYPDEMNDKFFAYNPGLRSRFTEVFFEDFDEKELLSIWKVQVEKKKWRESDPRISSVVVRRLLKVAGTKGFGNARAVRQKLDQACAAAMSRIDVFDPKVHMVLMPVDIVGENPAHNEKLAAVLQEVEAKTGWNAVKKAVGELVKVCNANYERELDGEPQLPVFLNRLFLGNPGTGKTTCARSYGKRSQLFGLLIEWRSCGEDGRRFRRVKGGRGEKQGSEDSGSSEGKSVVDR